MSLTWKCCFGQVTKSVVVDGKLLEKPKEMATCNIDLSFTDCNLSHHILYSELKKNNDNTLIVIGECDTELDRQIEKCVRTMCCGERCLLVISSEENQECQGINIALRSFTNELDVFELTLEQKLEIAKKHKTKGVELFQKGRDLDSFLRFSKAAKLMITLLMENNEDVNFLYTTVCNNMSLCQLKRGNVAQALTLSNKVLAVHPNNVKALLRRADALDKLNDNESAISDLKQVIKLEPGNSGAHKRLIVLQQKLNIENIKYANIVQRMFKLK